MTRTVGKRTAWRKGRKPRKAMSELPEGSFTGKVLRAAGYTDCACPQCFELAIGAPGAMCWECEAAGCDGKGDCCVDRSTDYE